MIESPEERLPVGLPEASNFQASLSLSAELERECLEDERLMRRCPPMFNPSTFQPYYQRSNQQFQCL